MSGGSFDYASLANNLQDMDRRHGELQRMVAALQEEGAPDAAQELSELLGLAEGHALDEGDLDDEAPIAARIRVLNPVLHSLEWWYSNDYSRQQFEQQLRQWRVR